MRNKQLQTSSIYLPHINTMNYYPSILFCNNVGNIYSALKRGKNTMQDDDNDAKVISQKHINSSSVV